MKIIGANSTKEKFDNGFIKIMLIMLLVILLLMGTIFGFLYFGNNQHLTFIAIFSLLILAAGGLLLLISGLSFILLWNNNKLNRPLERALGLFIPVFYPIFEALGKVLGYDKNNIRRTYNTINNKLVLSKRYNFKGEEILVLSPHCIQKSFCPHKLTNNINNCIRCGKCHVNDLISLSEKYGIQFRLVSGGTIARRIIMDTKPRAIVAIACERDLISGIKDIKRIPIIGVINVRPEGPCINTQVNIFEVESAIEHFIGG